MELSLAALVPRPEVALWAVIVAVTVGGSAALGVGKLRARGVKVAYTRKLFHVVVFSTAAGVNAFWALPGTLVFGSVLAAMVLHATWRGEGTPFYEALAREKDRPRRTLFILIPMVTTAVGGLASALLAGPYAGVGYLAAGWGDAAGEPVGARWGRHPYGVPSLAGVPATRTVEGSIGVFLVATIGSAVALLGLGHAAPDALRVGLACGLAGAGVEAVSNHGLDNFTVQLLPSLVAAWMLG